jgi:hypothetical protein
MRVNGVDVTMPDGQAEALIRLGRMVPRVCGRCGARDTPENRVFFRTQKEGGNVLPESWTDQKIAEEECRRSRGHNWYLKGCFAACAHCGLNIRAYGTCSVCGSIRWDDWGCQYGC